MGAHKKTDLTPDAITCQRFLDWLFIARVGLFVGIRDEKQEMTLSLIHI